MGVYLSTPKTEKFSEDGENDRLRYGLSSMQGWRATMEDAHAAYPDLDASTSFFGVYDGHGGKVVAKFCAKYLHQQVLKHEAYAAGDIGTSVQRAFFRMDEMMRGQRGWRELAILGDKLNKFTGMIEGLIWSPRGGDSNDQVDNWAFEVGPHSDFPGPTSGCTACVGLVRNNQLIVANAGDSRCVISRKVQAYNLSRDHKPDLEVEKERILKAGGFIHAGRVNGSLNLARAIGDMEFKQNKFVCAAAVNMDKYQCEGFKFCKALTTHCHALKLGTLAGVYTANKILNTYAKCKESHLALKLFDEIPHRDTVSWNTMISGFVNCGNLETACEILNNMKRCGFDFDGYTFGSLLKGVASSYRLEVGQQLHSMVVKMGYEENVYAGSALLDMYAKCEKVEDAYMVFKCLPEPNSVSWNALIAGFSQVGDRGTAFWLLNCMEKEGVRVEDGTFAPLLTLLDDIDFYKLAIQIHGKIIKHGLAFDNTVCNATITSYSECGSIRDARKVFDGAVAMRDIVSWNSILAAYMVHEKEEIGFQLFLDMQRLGFEPDIYTYTSVLSACFEKAHKSHGQSLHALVIKRGLEYLVPISNALIAMYLKSNNTSMREALKLFESMDTKDRVSWNSILTGFSQIGLSEDALKLFGEMRHVMVEIDHYAFSAVLRSCADLATLQLGRQVHALAIKSGFETNEFVASALIFMYSKCGMIEDAQKSFEETSKDNPIAWNSIIFGYAQNGQGSTALDLFFLMRNRKVRLDHITFVAVLTACSHIGRVEEGLNFLKSMESDYGIPPRMEHYACAVDLLGRAGQLDEARTLIESMPFKPDTMVWKTLLGACRACGDIELATQVASHLLELEPEEHCTYILLSHLYGNQRRWEEKASLTRLMRERGIKKVPGWSWIEIKNQVHAFNAEDQSHLSGKEIYQMLGELMEEITWLDTDTGLDAFISDFDR